MALPGVVFLSGLNQIWLPLGLVIGAYINWIFIARRLRVYTEVANNSLTIPAFFDNRFLSSNKRLRIVTSIVIIIFYTFYASAGFMACALLTQKIFGLPYFNVLIISSLVMVCYTCIGGFLAVNWIDFFQGLLMFFALLVVPSVVFYVLGGWEETFIKLESERSYLQPFHNMKIIGIISLLGWGLGYFGQPHILARFMAIRSHKEVPVARTICMTWMSLSLLGAVFTGLVGHAYFTGKLENHETVFIILAMELFKPWVSGILIAAVLSAIMSSVTAQLLSSASVLAEDIYHGVFRDKAKQKELLLVSRMVVIVISIIAVFLVRKPDNTILKVVSYAWAGLGASFGPVIFISLFWSKITRKAAILGMSVATFTVLVWPRLEVFPYEIFKLYELIPAFGLNVLTIFIVSKFDKVEDPKILADFEKVSKILKEK
jgi:sodium/proline symporter